MAKMGKLDVIYAKHTLGFKFKGVHSIVYMWKILSVFFITIKTQHFV
jgi:hypothetical protein